jgi:hypothetical protein
VAFKVLELLPTRLGTGMSICIFFSLLVLVVFCQSVLFTIAIVYLRSKFLCFLIGFCVKGSNLDFLGFALTLLLVSMERLGPGYPIGLHGKVLPWFSYWSPWEGLALVFLLVSVERIGPVFLSVSVEKFGPGCPIVSVERFGPGFPFGLLRNVWPWLSYWSQ